MNTKDNEELRHAVLEVLGMRPGIALPIPAIVRHVKKEVVFAFSPDDISAALAVLLDLDFVKFERDELGITQNGRATTKGVLRVERGV
jgi:hypothetical protein